MVTNLEGGGGAKALVAGPLKKGRIFFAASLTETLYCKHTILYLVDTVLSTEQLRNRNASAHISLWQDQTLEASKRGLKVWRIFTCRFFAINFTLK